MGRRAFRCLSIAALAVGAACSPAAPQGAHAGSAPSVPTAASSSGEPPSAPALGATSAPPTRAEAPRPVPAGKLRLADARRRMLALLNRDRASQGLPALVLDEGPAQRAAQRHAEDMARHSFLGHWGTDGSNPEQRHTEAGGVDMVLENASCVDDLKPRNLETDPLVDEATIAHAEHLFFDEVPPNDGHRRNILKPHHTRVGIGIALPVTTATEIGTPCFTQELVDGYGAYAPLPTAARVGQTVRVEGTISAPAVFGGVGVARVDSARAQSPAEANKRRVYPVPTPYQVYWPRGFVTPIPVDVSGATFRIDVPLDDQKRPGLYEISVFGKLPGMKAHGMLSLRTIEVR
ncbi:MAG: CAP domain-containing protein [Myxococcales bacterium]|nr:CAP domain-containing protein [Myxococcales bacterium]